MLPTIGSALFQSIVCCLYRKEGEDPELSLPSLEIGWWGRETNYFLFASDTNFLVVIVNDYSYSQVSS